MVVAARIEWSRLEAHPSNSISRRYLSSPVQGDKGGRSENRAEAAARPFPMGIYAPG